MIEECLDIAEKANQIAEDSNIVPCFVGAPGIGKTERIKAWAKKRGRIIEVLPLTDRDKGDYLGLPYRKVIKKKVKGKMVEQTITAWANAEWFSKLTDKHVLFLDEISNAGPDVRASMLPLLAERQYNGVKIPEGCVIVCATNPMESSENGYEFSESLITRLSFVYVSYNAKITADYLESVGNPLADFVRTTPIMEDDPASQRMVRELPKSDPRTVEQAGNILRVSQSEAAKAMVRGLVGEAVGDRAIAYVIDNKRSILTLYEIDGADTDNDDKVIERLSQISSEDYAKAHSESEHPDIVQEIVYYANKYRRMDLISNYLEAIVNQYYHSARKQIDALDAICKEESDKATEKKK